MSKVADVNTTRIAEAIRLGCNTMQNVFSADDDFIPFFRSVVYPEAYLEFHAGQSESHVPGRHLNELLSAEDAIDISVDEEAIQKHRKAAFFAFGGPVTLPLNRQTPDGPLVRYRDNDEDRELSERCIIFEL